MIIFATLKQFAWFKVHNWGPRKLNNFWGRREKQTKGEIFKLDLKMSEECSFSRKPLGHLCILGLIRLMIIFATLKQFAWFKVHNWGPRKLNNFWGRREKQTKGEIFKLDLKINEECSFSRKPLWSLHTWFN